MAIDITPWDFKAIEFSGPRSHDTRLSERIHYLCASCWVAGKHPPLIDYENKLGSEAIRAVPTPDHYLPLLYVVATRTVSEPVTFPVEGVDGGSISMLSVQAG